jgi:tetratricopeptide (TPR) repeat protein
MRMQPPLLCYRGAGSQLGSQAKAPAPLREVGRASACQGFCHRLLTLVRGLLLIGNSVCSAQGLTEAPCDLVNSSSLRNSALEALDRHQYSAAVLEFQRALDACPMQRTILLDISQAHARNRDFPQAIRAAQEFLQSTPDSISGHLALANAYFMAQRFPEARTEYEYVLKQAPNDPAALKLKGNIEYLNGDYEQSESTFIGLLDKHPNDEEAAYMLGRIYYMQGRIEHAAGQFQRVLKVNPQSYKAYDNLGLCYQARGETELATRHFLTSIKMVEKDHPDYDSPYANLAYLLLENNEYEKAFAVASKAADRNPYAARNFYLGGKALFKLRKTDLCLNWLQRSVALDPNYPEPLYLLSRVYGQVGQEEKRKETLDMFREVKARVPQTRR